MFKGNQPFGSAFGYRTTMLLRLFRVGEGGAGVEAAGGGLNGSVQQSCPGFTLGLGLRSQVRVKVQAMVQLQVADVASN